MPFRPFAAAAATAVAFAGLAAFSLLTGCSHERPQTALAPDFGLYFHQEDGAATLAYGRANSDEVGLVLQCAKGSRQVSLSDSARSQAPGRLSLASDGAHSEFPVRVETQESGQTVLWAKARSDDPALRAFRRSGRISVAQAGSNYGLTATRTERIGIEEFFLACEKA